jgi:F-type H+-transporting ATPase subunit b
LLNSLLVLALLAGPRLAMAAEAEGSGGGGPMEMLGLSWQGVLIQICGFLLLLWLLKRFLFGPLQTALSTRRTEIQGTYDRLDAQQRELDQRRADLEARLVGIENEARERILSAVAEAKTMQEQIISEAREQADRTIEQGRRMIQMEQEKAIATLREEMADLAVRAAGRLIDENLNDDRHRRIVSDFISQVGS